MSKRLTTKNKNNAGIVLIKKSNNLVESRYKFDIWETRFFLTVLGQIRREDTDFEVYRIWYKDVIKTFGLKSGDSYASLRDAAKSLIGKPVHINYEVDGVKRSKLVNLIRTIDYMEAGQEKTENHEYIDVKVETDLKPLLLQLQKNFTAYDLRNVIKLGVYSVRLYELLKQYESIGTRMMKVDEMKSMFQVEELYKLFGDFYRWVITPSEKEINKHTDLNILSIDKIREGKKIVALRFKFRAKTEDELNKARGFSIQNTLFDGINPDSLEKEEPIKSKISKTITLNTPSSEDETAKDALFLSFQAVVVGEFGVSPTVFLAELNNYSEEQIQQAIRVTQRAKTQGKIKNISGFFMDSLRKGFTDAKEETAKKQAIGENNKAMAALIQEQLFVLEDEYVGAINDQIRQLTAQNANITQDAIERIKHEDSIKKYIENREKDLQRPLEVEDFRKDKTLRDWVKQEIMATYPTEFQPLLLHFETKVEALREMMGKTVG
jgi:plasmid replication initiation protein